MCPCFWGALGSLLEATGLDFEGFWGNFEILDLLAEEMLELISNLKLKLFLGTKEYHTNRTMFNRTVFTLLGISQKT